MADASPVKLDVNNLSIRDVPKEWIEQIRSDEKGINRRHIDATMGAAQIWLKEKRSGAPWREAAERKQQIADEKSRNDYKLKRLNILAKQISTGLKTQFSITFDPMELFPLLVEAEKECEKLNPDRKKAALLAACLKFELPKVKDCLELTDRSHVPTPSLNITYSSSLRNGA